MGRLSLIGALAAGWPLVAGVAVVAWSRLRAAAPVKATRTMAAAERSPRAPRIVKKAAVRGESIGGV